MSYWLLVRGPLGAGKTTIARAVADRIGGRYLSIDRILEEHDLERWAGGYISEASFLAANDIAIATARRVLARGRPVVVDGNFYWRTAIEDLEERLPAPHLVVSLRLPLAACIARDAGRPRSFGAQAVRDVFAKVRTVDYGTAIDAGGPVVAVVRRLTRAARAAGLPLLARVRRPTTPPIAGRGRRRRSPRSAAARPAGRGPRRTRRRSPGRARDRAPRR